MGACNISVILLSCKTSPFIFIFPARSDVFEAESEGESEKSEDLQEGSCPVLFDDTETEKVSISSLIACSS